MFYLLSCRRGWEQERSSEILTHFVEKKNYFQERLVKDVSDLNGKFAFVSCRPGIWKDGS